MMVYHQGIQRLLTLCKGLLHIACRNVGAAKLQQEYRKGRSATATLAKSLESAELYWFGTYLVILGASLPLERVPTQPNPQLGCHRLMVNMVSTRVQSRVPSSLTVALMDQESRAAEVISNERADRQRRS